MGPALLHGLGIVDGEFQPGSQRQHRKAHHHTVVVVAVERRGGGVEPVCTAVDGDGAALALEDAAAGPQFGFHGCNAVALLDTETFRVADGGGPLAKQAQDHQHGAEVGAVGKVNVHTVERCFLEHDTCIGGAEACTTAAQNVEDRGIALQGVGG